MGWDRNRGPSYYESVKKNKKKNDDKLARKKQRGDASSVVSYPDQDEVTDNCWGDNPPDISDQQEGEVDCGELLFSHPVEVSLPNLLDLEAV
jgi:hypothetical protein